MRKSVISLTILAISMSYCMADSLLPDDADGISLFVPVLDLTGRTTIDIK